MDHDGITKDIQKLEAAGVGGVFIADVNLGIPDDGPAFNSPEWRKLLAHAATEAKEKGLVVALQPAAGWSGMGGPWVPVEDSIKELTWSVTPVQGAGERKTISLPEPKKNSNHYRDIAVLAIPGRGSENVADRVKLLPSSTVSAKNFEILRDQSLDKDVNLARETTIDIELPRTLVPGALRFRLPRLSFDRAGDLPVDLSTSTDGKRWVPLKTCDLRWNFGAPEVRDKPIQNSITVTLPPKTGRFLRLKTRFKAPAPVAEIEFLAGAHIDRREAKSALIMDRKHDSGFDEIHNPTDTQAAGLAIPKQSVVNLSGLMDAAGRLTWDVPVGDWRILRFGYTTTGRKKGVTRAGGQGWLVDILDPAALVRHLESYYGTLIAEGGPLDGGRLQILHSDSWEEFHANWTKGFSEQFANLRGYDPICFLPVIAGEAIVDSTEVSERFLWDFRRTLADLVVTNYYGTLHQWGKDRGLVMHSDHAGRQQWLTDPVRYQTATDIPIGEFWLFENSLRPDVKMAASAAHITGNNLASGEAFTDTGINDGWRTCPSRLKSIGDRAFCEGINLFNLHTYTAQPAHMPPPGVTLGKWGTILSRNRLWWEDFASEWHGYVQRCSELLREGRFSGDVLLIASDGAPSETGRSEDFPVPPGHGFDVGASELLEKATVENGEVVLPSGMRYRLVSFLGAEQRPTTLRQVKRLVEAGAAVHGPRPVRAPGLENYPASDVEVAALAGELWPDAGKTQRELGAGRLFTEMPISEVLKTIDLTPQFQADKSGLRFIRRETDRGPLYFVANPEADAIETTCRFRVSG
ncbi:MAG: glycosyl hydrolase, partial [Sphaerospermopsis kisseleviana]